MKWTPDQQKAITSNGTNIIVSAGAGSGKTAVLTERVLEKLKSGIHIDELLILTFTNAASLEMKERIALKIKKEPSLKEELKRIDAAYITTFDSFALSIVKKYHYRKNLSNILNIVDPTFLNLQKKKEIEQIFNEYYEKKDPNFLSLIDTFCVKDDRTLKEAILEIDSKLSLKLDRTSFLEENIHHFEDPNWIKKLKKDYDFYIEEKLSDIKDILENMSLYSDGTYIEKVENALSPLFEKNFSLFVKIPPLPKDSDERLKKEKETLKKEVDDLLLFTTNGFEKELECIQKTKPYVEVIIDLLNQLEKNIKEWKEKHDLYEFIDIELLAIKFIEENEDIRLDLKHKFKEIMIDEYQDTNDLQEYFISLIQENNVYMVGDIKQSIYRFRNANPYIFKSKYDQYKKNIGGIKIDLNQNFRSRKEVIDDINLLFSRLMDEKVGGASYLEEHQMEFGNELYVENKPNHDTHALIYTYPNQTKNKVVEEAYFIASDIKKRIEEKELVIDKETSLLRPVKPSDFAILLDRTTYVDEYIKVFENMKIPFHAIRDESIIHHDLLQLLKNIINWICEIDGKESFYYTSIARSFLERKSDTEIFNTIKNETIKTTDIYNKITQIRANLDQLTPRSLLEEIIKAFEIEEKLYLLGNIKENEKIIDSLYQISASLEEVGFTPLDEALYLEEIKDQQLELKLSSELKNNDSVTLMTIHKSKGLEFPICYFAGLTKKFNTSEMNELFLFDQEFGIITPYFDEGISETFIKKIIKRNNNLEEISEKIRLFYVALTRTKEKMIFVVPAFDEIEKLTNYERKKYKSFYDFLSSISFKLKPFIEEIEPISHPRDQEKKVGLLSSITPSNDAIHIKNYNVEFAQKEKKAYSKKQEKWLSKEEKTNIEFGLNIHEVFENANLLEDSHENFYVNRFLKQDQLKNRKKATIFKEYKFVQQENDTINRGIIDLMLEYEDHIDIIDYKLKYIEDEAYLKQLKGYQNYIKGKTKKEVYIYLYSILDDTLKPVEERK